MLKQLKKNKQQKPPPPEEVFLIVDMTKPLPDWELIQKESSEKAAHNFAKELVKKTNEKYGVFKLVGVTQCEIKVK